MAELLNEKNLLPEDKERIQSEQNDLFVQSRNQKYIDKGLWRIFFTNGKSIILRLSADEVKQAYLYRKNICPAPYNDLKVFGFTYYAPTWP